ncbi:MAG: ORF6N domain-containing protein [Prevotella sp.]|jgi:phage regulator Rha-like protein|nr:ORF6N domain-containing protein [Prevotella sp.]
MNLERIREKIITIQGQQVILDCEVASMYGVQTKEINQAIKNNPDKFPEGYIIALTDSEKAEAVKNFDRLAKLKFSSATVKGLSEKALYMLATILKSPVATETTLAIIETFAKVRELSRTVAEIGRQTDKEVQKNMLRRTGEIISDIINPALEITDTETTVELNLAVLSVKHTVKRTSKKE